MVNSPMPRNNTENNTRTTESNGTERQTETASGKNVNDVPNGGYGWIVVFCAFCINVLVDGVILSFGVLLPELVDYFNAKKSNVALAGTVMVGITLSSETNFRMMLGMQEQIKGGPIIGVIINRFGSRPPIIVGSVVAAVSFVSASFSQNLNVLIVVYGIFGGLGLGLMYLPVFVSASGYFDKKLPIANGIAICGTGIGTIAYPPFLEYLMNSYDWKMTLRIIASMTIAGGVVFGVFVRPFERNKDQSKPSNVLPENDKKSENCPCDANTRETNSYCSVANNIDIEMNKRTDPISRKQDKKNKSTFAGSHNTNDTNKQQTIGSLASDYFGLLKNPAFSILLIGNIFGIFAYMIPFIYIVDRALLLGISSKDAAFLLSIIGIVNTISRLGSGVIVSVFKIEAITLSITALIVGSVAGFLQQFCNEYGLLVLYCIVFGFSCAFVANAPDIVYAIVGVTKLANGMGFVLCAWGIGAVSGPYIAGLVFEATDNYNASFYLGGGSYMVAAITQIVVKIIARKSNNKVNVITIEVLPIGGNE